MRALSERSPPPLPASPAVRRLDPVLVDRIAAGEVVERPASAVKELVENAIDADARAIEVTLEAGGRRLIRVVDDGRGMSEADLALAVERHATSKLPDGDLTRIATLGFRGEALPSIGAVARLSLTTRAAGATAGAVILVEAGAKRPVRPAPAAFGTRVEVADLFAATPARLKFLKSDRAEAGAVAEIVRRLAVAHPAIRFVLRGEHTGNPVLPVQGEAEDPLAWLRRLADVLGGDFAQNALPLEMGREGFVLSGHVGLPTFHRGTSAYVHFVVNGRPVRDRLLLGAVRGAYADVMAGGRHPVLALALACAPDRVDVNVHPAKTEVRFRDPSLVRGLVVSAIHEALRRGGVRAATTVAERTLASLRAPQMPAAGFPAVGFASSGPAAALRAHGLFPVRPSAPPGFAETPQAAFDAGSVAPQVADEPAPEHPLGAARAQLHETYIVAQTADGIVLVDQHAAHERLVYERLKRERAGGGIARQGLLIPEVVELEPAAAGRLAEAAPDLAALGLALEPFGPGAVLVREVPAALSAGGVRALVADVADALADALADASSDTLEESGAEPLARRLDAVLSRMSCHGSIRAGRRLRPPEMDALLRAMEAEPLSGQCNHGRPTFVTLGLADIERLFGRR